MEKQIKPPEQNSTNQPPIEEIQPTKQEIILQKKERFDKTIKKMLFIIGLVIIGVTVITTVGIIYVKSKKNFVVTDTDPSKKEAEAIIKKEGEQKEITPEYYKNDKYRFSFEYEKKDKLDIKEKGAEDLMAQVISDDAIPQENPTGDILVKGYTFSVQPISLNQRSMDEAIVIKREAIVKTCPTTAEIRNISDRKIDDLDAKYFEVAVCNSDYIINYVSANGYVYEITQIFKGDLGIKQMYKSATEQMLDSLKIYRDEVVIPVEDFIYYSDSYGKFKFSYPSDLDTTCCFVATPPNVSNLETLAVFSEGENAKTIAVYKASLNGTPYAEASLGEFVQQQKQLLTDDYLIIKGVRPQGKEYEIDIKGRKGYVLEDFSWQDNDLIYIEPGKINLPFIVISKTDIDDEIYENFLESIEFF